MVRAGAGGHPYYVPTWKEVGLVISMINQTITVTGAIPEKIRYSGSGETYNILLATSSSGVTPNWRSETPSVCAVNGSQLTPLGFGTCTVTVWVSTDYAFYQGASRQYSILVSG
jgi:hypothetical protein